MELIHLHSTTCAGYSNPSVGILLHVTSHRKLLLKLLEQERFSFFFGYAGHLEFIVPTKSSVLTKFINTEDLLHRSIMQNIRIHAHVHTFRKQCTHLSRISQLFGSPPYYPLRNTILVDILQTPGTLVLLNIENCERVLDSP